MSDRYINQEYHISKDISLRYKSLFFKRRAEFRCSYHHRKENYWIEFEFQLMFFFYTQFILHEGLALLNLEFRLVSNMKMMLWRSENFPAVLQSLMMTKSKY